ncbi:MAG: glycoside hydrolase family 76 protein [Bacteroidales bacterium]|nr:glycoside hydrolase family 76 protein [Bacteroidales bacterium]MDD4822510.1 glycoside hydrolase family 76 protein [Bacteroidales bacterium]
MKRITLYLCLTLLIVPFQSNLLAQVTTITSGSIYKICSKASGKVLEVANSSMSGSANVDIWTDTQSDAQRWIVTSVGNDRYTLTNVASGYLLNIASNPSSGVNVNQIRSGATNSIQWKIVSREEDYFTVQIASAPDFVLHVDNAASADGTNVSIYKSNESDTQAWAFYLETPQEAAPSAAAADKIFAAWKSKYYDHNREGNEVIANEGFWGVAEMMEIVDDALEVTGEAKYDSLFKSMYMAFIGKESADWMWNEYNDDITWMVIACVRASQLTNFAIYQSAYLNKAKDQFDKMYARANHDGNWLTWKEDRSGGAITTTNGCINGPAMVACCYLAQATGDNSYYDKAIKLYKWSTGTLFEPASGKVNDSYDVAGGKVSNNWSSTYNQGTYLGAAVMLYNYTKDPSYLLDAQRIATYTKVNMFGSATINGENGRDLDGFKGILMRYARRYVVDCNKADYIPWLQLNAKVAYNNRNSEDLIYTRWGTKTIETATLPIDTALKRVPAFAASTAVSLMVNCPLSLNTTRSAYDTIEAESFNYFKSLFTEPCIEGTSNLSGIRAGDYSAYYNVDFGFLGADSVKMRLSGVNEGNTIEIRLGGITGTLIGTVPVPKTGSWNSYTTVTVPVTKVKGVQNIFLVYQGTLSICEINHFQFVEAKEATESNGLLGSYFFGVNLKKVVLERIDSTLDFNWYEFSPASEVAVNSFSARWTGKIVPRYSGTYTFYITSDNGRRVWINNQLIIDKWITDQDITYSGTIDLTAGEKYEFKVEYYESSGNANIKLEWESADQTREVIPNSQLFLPTDLPTNEPFNEVQAIEQIVLSTNPEKTLLTLECGSLSVAQVTVCTISGSIIFQGDKTVSGASSLDISNLSKGVYIVSVLLTNGEQKSIKFIK